MKKKQSRALISTLWYINNITHKKTHHIIARRANLIAKIWRGIDIVIKLRVVGSCEVIMSNQQGHSISSLFHFNLQKMILNDLLSPVRIKL